MKLNLDNSLTCKLCVLLWQNFNIKIVWMCSRECMVQWRYPTIDRAKLRNFVLAVPDRPTMMRRITMLVPPLYDVLLSRPRHPENHLDFRHNIRLCRTRNLLQHTHNSLSKFYIDAVFGVGIDMLERINDFPIRHVVVFVTVLRKRCLVVRCMCSYILCMYLETNSQFWQSMSAADNNKSLWK